MELHTRIEAKLVQQISQKLQDMRNKSGLNTDQAANLLGLDVNVLRSYESGRRGVKAHVLIKAAIVYKTTFDDLMIEATKAIELENAIEVVKSAGLEVRPADEQMTAITQ